MLATTSHDLDAAVAVEFKGSNVTFYARDGEQEIPLATEDAKELIRRWAEERVGHPIVVRDAPRSFADQPIGVNWNC